MSEILYNTNSTFISKFHQQQHRVTNDAVVHKNGTVTTLADPPRDVAFKSQYPKESDDYMKELCQSIYPETLGSRIDSITNTNRLNFHAVVALVVKNFVLNWYGVKISTIECSRDEFLIAIFNAVDETYTDISKAISRNVNIEQLILDDIPVVISSHLRTLRELTKCGNNNDLLNVENYCRLNLLQSECYLQECYINLILENFIANESILQKTFLDSILRNLIFGSILESISNTFYILDLINNIFMKLNDAKSHGNSSRHQKLDSTKMQINLLNSNLLSLILVDTLQLPVRNPFWFSILNVLIKLALYIPMINAFVTRQTQHHIAKFMAGPLDFAYLMKKLRNVLFPNDNMMGPRRIVPQGEELLQFKRQVTQNMLTYFNKNTILKEALMITEEEISELIDLISLDNQCNKIFLLQLIEPLVVLLLSEKKSNAHK